MSIFELNAQLAEENNALREEIKELKRELETLQEEYLDAARALGERAEPALY